MTALEGLTIIDFSRFLPGAYASWVAADMGADVIRIEHPRELIKQDAIFGKDDDPVKTVRRRARPTFTRNKRSLLINPGHAAAKPVLVALIAKADVLIEDYRPGVLASMGYGYAEMAKLNPRLIYLSTSFAGQTGPLAKAVGHDPLALSLAGVLSRLNGQTAPTLPGLPVADVLTGSHATIAMLLALAARDRSGKGQHCDVAMSDASLPLHLVHMMRQDNLDATDGMTQPGQWHPKGGVWLCADGGYVCTSDMEPAYWARFCDAIGKPHFAALQHDRAQYPMMEVELKALFLTKTRAEWHALLSAANTQVMPVYSAEDALNHPHNQARGMVLDVATKAGSVRQLGLPFTLSDTKPVPPVASGLAGADTADILRELGFDQDALEKAGAFT